MIHAERAGHLLINLKSENHQIQSGLESAKGGGDEAMNPHQLLEAALAACTLQTLELYAFRKGWDVSGVKIDVTIDKEGPDAHITRKIDFGNLPDEQKARLLEISNKCPIHKLLVSEIEIENA